MWKSGVKRRKDALPKKAAKYDTACECCGNWNQMESICKKGTKSGQNCQKSKVFGIYRTTYEISNLNVQPMLGARPYRKVHLRVFSLYLCNFPIPSLRTAETYRKKTCWSVAVTYTILYLYYTYILFKKSPWASLRSWWRQTGLSMKVLHALQGKLCQTAIPLLSMDARSLMGNTWKVCSMHIWVFHFRNFSASYWREGHIWSVTDSVIGIPTTIAPQSSVLAPNICKDIYDGKYLNLLTKKL